MATTEAVSQALATQAGTPEEQVVPTLQKAIDLLRPQVARALPNTLDADRFVRIVLTEIRRSPELQLATQASFLGAVMTAAQLGLEFGPLGFAYLVPFKTKSKTGGPPTQECQLIIGYKGLIDLHMRSGRVRSIVARPVYERDVFTIAYDETGDHLLHEPFLGSERGPIVRYYGRAVMTDGGAHLEVMELEDIAARRNRSKAADSGPWKTDEVAMSLKTVVRKMSPWLPATPVVAEALEADENVVRLEGTNLVVERDDLPPGGASTLTIPANVIEAPPIVVPSDVSPPEADQTATGSAEEESKPTEPGVPSPDAPDDTPPAEEQPTAAAAAEDPAGLCQHGISLEEQCEQCDEEEQEFIRAAREHEQMEDQLEQETQSTPPPAPPAPPPARASEEPTPVPAQSSEKRGGPRSLAQADADRILSIMESLPEEKVVELLRGFGLGTQGNINAKRLRLYQRVSEGVLAGEPASLDLI